MDGLNDIRIAAAGLRQAPPNILAYDPQREQLETAQHQNHDHQRGPSLKRNAAEQPCGEHDCRVEESKHCHHDPRHGHAADRKERVPGNAVHQVGQLLPEGPSRLSVAPLLPVVFQILRSEARPENLPLQEGMGFSLPQEEVPGTATQQNVIESAQGHVGKAKAAHQPVKNPRCHDTVPRLIAARALADHDLVAFREERLQHVVHQLRRILHIRGNRNHALAPCQGEAGQQRTT